MMIDILVPSYQRPKRLEQMILSCHDTAINPGNIRFYVYLDFSDDTAQYIDGYGELVTFIIGQKKILSQCWNDLYKISSGEILMHCSDDIIFETQGWDKIVTDYFKDNHVGLLYGRDGHQDENCATHSFTTRKAADTIGYFVPPYFEADWNDYWLMQVYTRLSGRTGKEYIRYDDRIMTRHLHRNVDIAFDDETYQLADERRQRASKVWEEKNHLIDNDVQKLLAIL